MSFAPPWGIVRSLSVTRPSNGQCPCSGTTWHGGAGFAHRRVRSGGSCTPLATFGSDRGTYSTRIPSARKKVQIRREISQLPPRCVKLFEDETDLLLFPPLRAAWGVRGRPLKVPISGFNARRVVFGTINIDTGHRLFLARRRQRGEDFRAFLSMIHNRYRSWQVALLLDEDPSHTANGSKVLAAEMGISLIWLPKRCPELNGMDHLWGHGKDHILANRQYLEPTEKMS
jgi:DDE superfamily endonuclease